MSKTVVIALLFLNLSSCCIDAPTCGDDRLDPGEACDGIYYASNQSYS